jgi:hypothetical protein
VYRILKLIAVNKTFLGNLAIVPSTGNQQENVALFF